MKKIRKLMEGSPQDREIGILLYKRHPLNKLYILLEIILSIPCALLIFPVVFQIMATNRNRSDGILDNSFYSISLIFFLNHYKISVGEGGWASPLTWTIALICVLLERVGIIKEF